MFTKYLRVFKVTTTRYELSEEQIELNELIGLQFPNERTIYINRKDSTCASVDITHVAAKNIVDAAYKATEPFVKEGFSPFSRPAQPKDTKLDVYLDELTDMTIEETPYYIKDQ